MTIRDEIAASITGCQYRSEVSKELHAKALAAGVVIVYGASDDLMEFDGAISDEIGAYDGTTAYLTSSGLLENECDDDECPHFERLKEKAATIEAVWGKDGYSWQYKTAIPHVTFDVMEDGDTYCKGIVFNLADVQP